MTPNPNPSPELLDWTQPVEAVHTSGQINPVRVVQQGRGEPHAFALVEFCRQFWGCTEDGTVTAYGWRVRNAATLSPQTLPAPGEVDYAEMLQTAWESCPSGDGLGLPPIIFSDAEAAHIVESLATVAAANDEKIRQAARAAVGNNTSLHPWHVIDETIASIRLWSQGEGK